MRIEISGTSLMSEELINRSNEIYYWYQLLKSNDNNHLGAEKKGWVKIPEQYFNNGLDVINRAALKIINKCTLFIIVGIGGSFLGAKAVIPIIEIQIEKIDEYTIGKMIYFFEMSAVLSAYALGVNPFDQPGVDAYKREMQKLVFQLK